MLQEIQKAQDESLKKLKRVVYPFWFFAFLVNSMLVIGYFYQDKLISRGSESVRRREKLS